MKEDWKVSASHRSVTCVSFKRDRATVEYPENFNYWTISSDVSPCTVSTIIIVQVLILHGPGNLRHSFLSLYSLVQGGCCQS